MHWLVAVDLEDRADVVVDKALAWVGDGDHTVDLLYVGHRPARLDFIEDPTMRAAAEQQYTDALTELRRRMDALVQRVPAAQRGTARVVEGHASDEILAHGKGADIIAIATHGRTGLTRLWMGSVAEKVLRFAAVPVLVLRFDEA